MAVPGGRMTQSILWSWSWEQLHQDWKCQSPDSLCQPTNTQSHWADKMQDWDAHGRVVLIPLLPLSWEGCSQWRLDVTLAWCFSPGLTSCVITAIHQLFMAGKSCGELGHDPLGIKLICCNVITKLIHCLVWATAHHFHVFLGRESNTECFWEQKGQRQIIFHTFPKEACGACCPNNESRA